MIHCVIIDDEQRSINVLKSLLTEHCPNVKIDGTADDAMRGIELIRQRQPELVFLDVRMPGLDGFELLSKFPERPFKVIFTTAYDNHAIEAIKHSAFDYLLKPISINELKNAVLRYTAWKEKENVQQPIKNEQHSNTKLPISSVHGYNFINTEDIIWLQASEAYTIFHLADKKTITASGNLKKFEEMLDRRKFLRIHHSHVINSQHMVRYVRAKHAYVIMSNGAELEVSQRRRDVMSSVLL